MPPSRWPSAASTTSGRGRPSRTYNHRMSPAAAIATADLEGSIAEVQRVAKLGFRALTLPCKPVWGAHDVDHPNYNLPVFDPLWAAIQDANLPITFHVSTGRDPRAAARQRRRRDQLRLALAVADDRAGREPLRLRRAVALPAAALRHHRGRHRLGGVAARRAWTRRTGSITSGCGRSSPSCPASTSASTASPRSRRTRPAWRVAESMDLADNFMWGNDYPHHEGTWPHSAEAIERTMGAALRRRARQGPRPERRSPVRLRGARVIVQDGQRPPGRQPRGRHPRAACRPAATGWRCTK